jgi:hypothetical protein
MLGRKIFTAKDKKFQQWPGGQIKNFSKKERKEQ